MAKLPLELSGEDPRRGLNRMARGLVGSEILKIAAEIRAAQAAGSQICNLTVGDFSAKEFPVPEALGQGTARALAAGETNYPPADGLLALRQAVCDLYRTRLSVEVPLESVVIAGGARPIIFAAFGAVVEAGDKVVYPVPSWNNNHYCHLSGARPVEVRTDPANGFMPTPEELSPHLRDARLLALCTPLNPTGTVLSPEGVKRIAQMVVDENRRRDAASEKPLYLLFDQVYWMLTFGEARHVAPPALVPESARYTIFVDGISKGFAATGLRVGWSVGPTHVISAMKDLIGHMGAWAPRPEQVATAQLLQDAAAVDAYGKELRRGLQQRLDRLHEGLSRMEAEGLPVRHIPPQGAIYLSARFDLVGKAGLKTNDDVRRYLLQEAGFGVVPFQAFGYGGDTGWFRISVGAVSLAEIDAVLPRLEAALKKAAK